MGAMVAWLFLGETLRALEMLAIAVTLSGIAWVILERHVPQEQTPRPRNYPLGVLCGVGAAAGQAVGLVLSKQGMVGDFSPVSASLIRLSSAALMIWLLALVQGEAGKTLVALRTPGALRWILGGVLVGPVLGMTLSLAAVQLTHVGIASTLMALSPIMLLPLARWIFHERITLRAVLGTAVAMIGVAMIFLV